MKKKIVLFENEHKRVIEKLENQQISLKYSIKKKETELKEKLFDLKGKNISFAKNIFSLVA